MTRWPELETGRNSVSPCRSPRNSASRLSTPAGVCSGSAGAGGGSRLGHAALAHHPAADPFDRDVGRRNDEKCEDRREEHAAHHRDAQRSPGIAAGAASQRDRQDADHGRQRRHQDRAEPPPRRLGDGLDQRHAAPTELVGELHDQNGILGHEPDQHHETDLAEEIQCRSRDLQRDQRTRERERDGDEDRDGMGEAFELRRQHQEDAENRQSIKHPLEYKQ